MKEIEITPITLYDLTRVFAINNVKNEVWISKKLIRRCSAALDDSLENGAKISLDKPLPSCDFMVAGYFFIAKPDIEGLMCFGGDNFYPSGKDLTIEEMLEYNKPTDSK